MKPQIQFVSGIEEIIVPRRIRLTKSENGETGTATFIFINPSVFSLFSSSSYSEPFLIESMELLWDNKKIKTNDIAVFFKRGQPIIIRSILIFKNSKEWFNFLNFMNSYAKETGLSFTEGN